MYISIDIGGTKTRIASSYDLKTIHRQEQSSTFHQINKQKDALAKTITEVLENEPLSSVKGICIGIAGIVDKKNHKFGKIINIPEFSDLDFSALLPVEFSNSIVTAENDAALAGLGEAVLGAGANYEVVAYLTLSTGVGGVRIANKILDTNQRFFEPGHMIIEGNGKESKHCAVKGCFTAYSSGTSFEKIYGMDPKDCLDTEVWNDYGEKLSWGINNVIVMWNPDVIVLGGGMSNKLNLFIGPLMHNLSKNTFFDIPDIVRSQHKDSSGLIGGLVHLAQTFNSN